MLAKPLLFTSLEELEGCFDEAVEAWGVSLAERNALRGTALLHRSPRKQAYSDFEIERMALVTQIHGLLSIHMQDAEIKQWLRRPLAETLSSPLQELFGSTDRLRRMRAMLATEVSQ